ncbi:MAG: UDP-N-acetylmuramate--L-alanine ligase [Actinomycetota bacterium]|nr:UDP-N-acetylmuramate--L-alanine ligase [Actinomycetota bacterium]
MDDPISVPTRVHIVGAGGAGMSGLAKLLRQQGHDVSGSDLKPGRMLSGLGDIGIDTWIGHRTEMMSQVELVVASSAVPDSDAELVAARDAGVRVWRRPELLRSFTLQMPTTGLAGTHGKTTSTALMVTAMRGIGLDPTFLVGGELIGMNTGAHLGDPSRLVLEADEAFGTFRHLALDSILVTNVEADHLDHYGTLAALEDAFSQVTGRVAGPRVGCIDDPGVRRLARRVAMTSYGFDPDADWVLGAFEPADAGSRFQLTHDEMRIDVTLPKPGAHLALNAAGVLVLLNALDVDIDAAALALSGFTGVRRRYEIAAHIGAITIVDDYAHHPTEVTATISAARQSAQGDVIVVFQPHRYTRTADLAPLFGGPLAMADRVFVTDIYAAGEPPIIGVSGRIVAEAVEAAGGRASFVPRIVDIADRLSAVINPGDTVLLLGAGDINSIVKDIVAVIESSL